METSLAPLIPRPDSHNLWGPVQKGKRRASFSRENYTIVVAEDYPENRPVSRWAVAVGSGAGAAPVLSTVTRPIWARQGPIRLAPVSFSHVPIGL